MGIFQSDGNLQYMDILELIKQEAAQIFFTHFSSRLIWVKLRVSLSELALGANNFLTLPPL
jgi:hypothetical protein